jgi:membrane fusion protein YbhG
MSLNKRLFFLVVAFGALGAGVFAYFRLYPERPAHELVLYGNVDLREVAPAFNDNGPINRILVEEGDRVEKGELLASLDDRRYLASLAEALGKMNQNKAALEKLLAGSRPEEIAQAKATMEALRATSLNDLATWSRYARLVPANAATVQQRDDARAVYESTWKQYEAARQAYILAVKGPRIEDIDAARAASEADRGAVALARRKLADTRLYAPSDGIIEDRILEVGDMASPSSPVFTLALVNPLWVRAYVPESELGKVALGTRATITTDSFPGRRYPGWVGYLSPIAEFTPKTVESPALRTRLVYQLRVYVCNISNELRLGMPATVTIDLSPPREGEKLTAAAACRAADDRGK